LLINIPDDTDAQAGVDDTDEADIVQRRFQRFRTWHQDRKRARRRKLETAHPEIVSMWDDLEKVPIIKLVAAPQPAAITRTLKSFQLEGLDWMIKQEKTHYKGGLLGDEMGMGKTIQAVSLIMSDFPAKAPCLVLVPPVALMQWQNEINSYTDNTLKVLVVHGSNTKSKNLTVKMLKTYNVVLMSYNSLESMHRKQEKGWARGEEIIKEDSPIHAIHWHRIILDEAHSIKSRTTGSAKACFALEGTYKWCLSGTPVQNRIGEFFSLLRFLGVRPFADYFCERCDCAQLHWTIDDEYKCKVCKHSASEHRSVFNEEILNPIIGESGLGNRDSALEKLHLITDRMMLRRMKQDHTSSMELPPKLVHVRNEFFSKVERDFATSIMSNTTRQFDTYVSRGVVLNNYANIFGLLMMMRQVANHPDLILKKNAEGGQNVLVCNICDEAAEDAVRSKCHHEFCRTCVKTYINSSEQQGNAVDCPRCHIVSQCFLFCEYF
jgi:DNA repair protein RAD16